MSGSEIKPKETSDHRYVICPYCGHKHSDSWEFCTEDGTEINCSECDKEFRCWATVSVTYNGAPL